MSILFDAAMIHFHAEGGNRGVSWEARWIMVAELAHPDETAQRLRAEANAASPDDRATKLIWNGVCGCRQIEICSCVSRHPYGQPEKLEERVVGEVAEPLS